MDDLFNEIENMIVAEGDDSENINTVKLYEFYNNENEFAIVMELGDNNLLKFLSKRNPFNVNEIRDILNQLNNTFKIMDENKLAHRDLKLENIILKQDNTGKNIFKIADYGLSKKLITLSKLTSKVGTLSFMAPEIIKSENYNLKCDLWSLGVIIYNLCFRVYPYDAKTEYALVNQIKKIGQKNFKKKGHIYLDNLISKLLVEDLNERLGWKEYFEHPFFKQVPNKNQIIIKIKVGENDRKGDQFKNIYFLQTDSEDKNINCNELNNENCEIYINNEKKPFSKYFKPNKEGIYEIKVIFKNKIQNCSYMFHKCNNIRAIDLSSFDTSNVTNMSYMFNECFRVEEINLDNLNGDNVTDMSYIFNKCNKLKKIEFPNSFNTPKLENIASMFHWCENLSEFIFPSSFQTDIVKNMKLLFGKCYNIKKIDLSNFNTEEVKDMSYMFAQCYSLEEIKIDSSKFKTDKVTNMTYMFSECSSLKKINLSSFNIENARHISYMFYNCEKLIEVDLSRTNNNKEANMSHMFDGCKSIQKINISTFKNINIMNNMFDNLSKSAKIYVNESCIKQYEYEFRAIDNPFFIYKNN